MPYTHRLTPGEAVDLAAVTTKGKRLHPDREAAEAEFFELRREFAELQRRWYADGRRKLLIVLQAMDAGGKDGTIRKVFRGVNPQGVCVTSFKKPTEAELARDFLWRIHRAVPAAGMIGVFNRSHYEDVLIARVDELVAQNVWQSRYAHINNFEQLLAESGTTILKFYLHISKKEQAKRFQKRLDDREKHWKFSRHDLEVRRQWNDYMAAYQDALNRCTTECAPWYVIPADQKWYRNLAVARAIVQTLRELDPRFPRAANETDGVKID